MDKPIDKYTGAVSVEANITPTTREPIPEVKPINWKDMSTSQLWEEKTILQQRIAAALSCGHPELVVQIQRGVATIDQLLNEKHAHNDTILY